MMHSASRDALAALREQLDRASDSASAEQLSTSADELYSVAALFVAQPRLRRTIGDPSTDADQRGALIGGLLRGKVSELTGSLVGTAARQRWSTPWDLADGLEQAGDAALFASADRNHTLDEVEDELFRFERILGTQAQLVALFDQGTVPAERRLGLLRELVGGKVSGITQQLLEHAVSSARKRSIELAIDDLLEAAARRRQRSIARVVSAVPLTDEQENRLATRLGVMYGRQISVRTALDPGVQGGLVIRIGDELIDGSVATRFAQARAALSF